MTDRSGNTPDARQLSDIVQNLVLSINNAANISEHNTTRLVEAFESHAEALVTSSESSEKVASRLVWATWALVGVTILLVLVGILQVFILIQSGPT